MAAGAPPGPESTTIRIIAMLLEMVTPPSSRGRGTHRLVPVLVAQVGAVRELPLGLHIRDTCQQLAVPSATPSLETDMEERGRAKAQASCRLIQSITCCAWSRCSRAVTGGVIERGLSLKSVRFPPGRSSPPLSDSARLLRRVLASCPSAAPPRLIGCIPAARTLLGLEARSCLPRGLWLSSLPPPFRPSAPL